MIFPDLTSLNWAWGSCVRCMMSYVSLVFSFKSVWPLRVVKLFNLLYTVTPGASKALQWCSDCVRVWKGCKMWAQSDISVMGYWPIFGEFMVLIKGRVWGRDECVCGEQKVTAGVCYFLQRDGEHTLWLWVGLYEDVPRWTLMKLSAYIFSALINKMRHVTSLKSFWN